MEAGACPVSALCHLCVGTPDLSSEEVLANAVPITNCACAYLLVPTLLNFVDILHVVLRVHHGPPGAGTEDMAQFCDQVIYDSTNVDLATGSRFT